MRGTRPTERVGDRGAGASGRRAAALVAAAAVLTSLAACARPGAPPGGPADVTPPRVMAVSPESLAVDVPLNAPIVVTFSEKIDHSNVESAVWVTPRGLAKPKVSFNGDAVKIESSAPFPESTTVGVLLTTVIKDRQRSTTQNPLERPYRWIFSTGDSIWPGRVSGRVAEVGMSGTGGRRRGQLLVGLYPGDADTVPAPGSVEPDAITEALADGSYSMNGLPADGRRRWLVAMLDLNGNREISGSGEFASASPESVVLTPEHPDTVVALRLVNPAAPGEVSGSFTRAAGDTVEVWAALVKAEADSTARSEAQVRADSTGSFGPMRVPPGKYRLRAFCDVNRNGRRDPEEAWTVYQGAVTVQPAAKLDMGSLAAPDCRR
jgi:hypothetical protein